MEPEEVEVNLIAPARTAIHQPSRREIRCRSGRELRAPGAGADGTVRGTRSPACGLSDPWRGLCIVAARGAGYLNPPNRRRDSSNLSKETDRG